MKSLLETLDDGTKWLEKKGIENPRRNMQLMLCNVLAYKSPMHLYTEFERPMKEPELGLLRDMLKRRSQKEPLQYILGSVEFYKREFKTDNRALIPRPETEELVDIILKSEIKENAHIIDVGCGSGVIGLTLAAELASQGVVVTLVDISEDALELARENAALLEVNNVTFLHSDLLAKVGKKADLLVANLPYIPEFEKGKLEEEVNHDPDLALYSGKDGLDAIRRLITQATELLYENALFALEIGAGQSEEVENLLAVAQFSSIQTKPDLNGIARFPLAYF